MTDHAGSGRYFNCLVVGVALDNHGNHCFHAACSGHATLALIVFDEIYADTPRAAGCRLVECTEWVLHPGDMDMQGKNHFSNSASSIPYARAYTEAGSVLEVSAQR